MNKKEGNMYNKKEKDSVKIDQLGENITITQKEGLSTPEAEEGGDFEGTSKMRTPRKKEGRGSTGNMMYDPDFKDIPAGTTGRNTYKDPNLEKQGSGEAE